MNLSKTLPFAAASCALALYVQALGHAYVWDDLHYLAGAGDYQGVSGVFKAVSEPFSLIPAYYRPLAMLSFVVSAEPAVQHGINVALHALNTALVFYVAQALMPRAAAASRGGVAAAALGALLFAAHPVGVEAVAWVSGRFDTLMSTFVLGTSLVVLGGELTHRRLALASVLFFAALGSKESAAGLPVALPFLLLLKWRLAGEELGAKETVRRLAPPLVALALAVALYAVCRWAVMPTLLPSSSEAVFRSSHLADKLNVSARAIMEFACLLVNPWSHSAPLHPFTYETGSGLLPQTLLVAAVVLALLALAFWKRTQLNVPLALLAALAMSWPALHVMDMYNRDNIISDRYALAPLALLLVGLAATVGAWQVRRAPATGAGEKRALVYAGVFVLLWTGALAAHTNVTIPMWRNEPAFWAFAHRQAPGSSLAHKGYIDILMAQGRWHEANEEFGKLWAVFPDARQKMEIADITNWMLVRARAGDYEGALEAFGVFERAAGQLASASLGDGEVRAIGKLYRTRGLIEGDAGHWDLAAHYLEKSVQILPEDSESISLYSYALYKTGRERQSGEVFGRALARMTAAEAARAKVWRSQWKKD